MVVSSQNPECFHLSILAHPAEQHFQTLKDRIDVDTEQRGSSRCCCGDHGRAHDPDPGLRWWWEAHRSLLQCHGGWRGSGNKTTGGLAGFFGAGGAGYSHTDLAGILLTGMKPLSPYLNVDPHYLVQDTDEFIVPTGANKTRGRFELAFFTIGGCCMTGAAFGAVNGLRLGLKETQSMAWSKRRNAQILIMVTRQGALWANTLGSLALLYSAFVVIIEKTRDAEEDLNTVAAGTMTGMLYKCTGGLRGIAHGGLAGLTLTSLCALYNNWEHMKGSLLQQSL
ncbi:mitochondrial import inner membrane translocase subunit Tim23-like [Peromyscus leucopus]|uniref:mitochondrial import inner membrane translocase subunit Tim23-like n=1 Tax=Peromyscus leucopus TaxID=10041 RepID=UPI0018858D8C|nr:mitochondrial import inner membrane translocase subunit Tim23-like [Peromyscus leucopus]